MKYVFCSSVYDMSQYENIAKKSKVPASLADHNLNFNLILGLDRVTGAPVSLINHVPIPSFPKFPRIFFFRQQWSHAEQAQDVNCGFISLPVIKQLTRSLHTYKELCRLIKKNRGEEICVLTYDLHPEICSAILRAKKRFPEIITCAFLPDIPVSVIEAANGGAVTPMGKLRAGAKMRYITRFDSYGLVAEPMKTVADIEKKPHVVVEGIYNNHQGPLAEKTTEKKVIFYSGQLNPAYGMENLLEAFLAIYKEDPSFELWICGGGGLAERIRTLSETCDGVKFFGYVDGKTVREKQAEASVLVNPRQNIGEFTKYSFPSKTMEYLASGRPVVGYKLDGIPDEYDPFMQYVPDNSVEALRKTLMEVCAFSPEKREQIGQKSREFILSHKTPEQQCAKLVSMLQACTPKRK